MQEIMKKKRYKHTVGCVRACTESNLPLMGVVSVKGCVFSAHFAVCEVGWKDGKETRRKKKKGVFVPFLPFPDLVKQRQEISGAFSFGLDFGCFSCKT